MVNSNYSSRTQDLMLSAPTIFSSPTPLIVAPDLTHSFVSNGHSHTHTHTHTHTHHSIHIPIYIHTYIHTYLHT